MSFTEKLQQLFGKISGDLYFDNIYKILYSTDASAYKETPLAICRPKNDNDIRQLIKFATENQVTIIPRAAGTSLAGQVVGKGIVMDISTYYNKIIAFNKEEQWIKVQPGVNLDELNQYLKPHGLFFGPETSTANRCLMGGMVGNNACGLHSLVYGSTRDHTLSIKAILSDGSEAEFKALTKEEFLEKCKGETLEASLYRNMEDILSRPENQENIRKEYPDPEIHRRNTGYAIDLLLETEPFSHTREKFNFCKMIAGSEGTLAIITEICLNLVPTPPPVKGLVCVHMKSVEDALHANLIGLNYAPQAIELMDDKILELTKGNIEQQKNRFFVEGDPGAILIVEFAEKTREEVQNKALAMEKEMREKGFGYHFPLIFGADISKVWNLRKAGLGVLSNMIGDGKPVSVIEDTAINPSKLPDFIKEFNAILAQYKLACVYHAHIATGELHLRPILNLKDPKDVEMFRTIARETALLVKKFRGSLSGEHGDGRLRGEFIPLMVGVQNYQLLKQIKQCWDPQHIFNANKIVDTPPMNTSLRYEPGKATREIETIFDFSSTHGIMRAAENCNGSGDCRKSERIGGTMCPSYMATRDEKHVTRARANILREFLTNSTKKNPFDHKEIYEVLDLCLSCKACKSECPSNVDIAKLKAEFLQHYYDSNGVPLRTRLIANITHINALGSIFPGLMNFFMQTAVRKPFMSLLGFKPSRKMPRIAPITLTKWNKKKAGSLQPSNPIKTVYLFNDEFTNYNDSHIGIKAIQLLTLLGYNVLIPNHGISGRSFLSKGLIRKARSIAIKNVLALKDVVNDKTPIIGIEPSAILTFRDEYPDLLRGELKEAAKKIAQNAIMIDEFISGEIDKGHITKEQFTKEKQEILYHGHCQQKAISSTAHPKKMMSLPENYTVSEIPSGCCGMAGSFGYEKEHYDVSMKVGELVLFPTIRSAKTGTIICASGTSCRHQIMDGTGVHALHPVEVLYGALDKKR